jgi:hypothetical protein
MSPLKQYRRGTFDRRIAYGQRQRKLMLVSRGIIDGFEVCCESTKDAANLARAFRSRCPRIEQSERAKYRLRVRTEDKVIYVTRKGPLH